MSHLASLSGDPDWEFPLTLKEGVLLGVSDPTLTSLGVWPTKEELKGEAWLGEDPPPPVVDGPFTRSEAAERCRCKPEELCPGPLAGIDESDKIRTIYDGSKGGANAHIQEPPTQGETFIILKADVTKAHRRIKVLQKDWKYQVACIQIRWWVNRVGTYGMASAQLYWGRQASLVLRLLYYIFPQVDWHLVFVDDYCWVLRCSRADWDATAILATFVVLGVPLSWKKTALSPVNTWLGFVVDPITPCVLLAPVKHVIILATLKRLAQGDIFTSKEVEQALGRIQWATSACPLTRETFSPCLTIPLAGCPMRPSSWKLC